MNDNTQGPATAATPKDRGDGRGLILPITRDKGALRQRLEDEAAAHGVPLKALTVLSPQRDPFRYDTPANHRDAAWLAQRVQELIGSRRVHLRGAHYILLGSIKPDGTLFLMVEGRDRSRPEIRAV